MSSRRVLILTLCTLLSASPARSAEKPGERKFATPAECVAAAEDAFGTAQYDAYADCFSPAGQADVAKFYLSLWSKVLSAPPRPADACPMCPGVQKANADGKCPNCGMKVKSSRPAPPDPEKIKAVLRKHGVNDASIKEGETPDQHAARLLEQIKDKRVFLDDALSMMFPRDEAKPATKGTLEDLKITAPKAAAKYAIKDAEMSVTQDIAFESAEGSWKIASFVFFAQKK